MRSIDKISSGDSMKNKYAYLFAIPPLIGIVLFLYHFAGTPVSHELTDWAHFGEYFHAIVEACNLVLLYKITQIAHNLQEKVSEDEISMQKTNLEKQLKFELFKDFITKIDEYIGKFLENHRDESSKLYIVLIDHLAISAKENFEGLIDNKEFDSLCDELSEKAMHHLNENSYNSFKELIASANKTKTILCHEVRLDSK